MKVTIEKTYTLEMTQNDVDTLRLILNQYLRRPDGVLGSTTSWINSLLEPLTEE